MGLTILELPTEVFQEILFHAILVRGVKRGLRLRLVCKAFSNGLQPALLATRLLDSHYLWRDPFLSHRCWFDKFWYDHCRRRFWDSRNQPQSGSYYSYLCKIAETYCKLTETKISIAETIDALCWLALRFKAKWRDLNFPNNPEAFGPDLSDSLSLLLLYIATYLKDVDLAKRLLREKDIYPWTSSERHRSPLYLAAYTGNIVMFNLFKERIVEVVASERPDEGRRPGSGTEAELAFIPTIVGACEGGSVETLQLAVRLPRRPSGNVSNLDIKDGELRKGHTWAKEITNSVEICKYVDSMRGGIDKLSSEPKEPLSYLLYHHCARGNIEIVQYILDQGVDPNERCCIDDPNDVTPLRAAAGTGSLAIVRKLLDHGAMDDGAAIHAALMLEHTSMVHLLLQNCPRVDTDWKYKILHNVKDRGLESMEGIVRQTNQLMATPSELPVFKGLDEDLSKTFSFELFLLI